MEYITISDIKEFATIGIAGAKPEEGMLLLVTTVSAPPAEIVWDEEGLRAESCSPPLSFTSFIRAGSLFFFDTNSRKRVFSSVKFNHAEDKLFNSRLNM